MPATSTGQLMPRINRAITQPWVKNLRRLMRAEHGFGWSVTEQSGKVKLTLRDEDGSRSFRVLPITWNAVAPTQVLAVVGEIRRLMEEVGLSLDQAVKIATESGDVPKGRGGSSSEGTTWSAIAEAFLKTREGLRPATLRDLRSRVQRALAVLESSPRPRDGRELLRAYARRWFENAPPGGMGRKRAMLDVVALLRFAVERHGVPSRWAPPGREEIQELIGHREQHQGPTTPLKPEQLAAVLDSMQTRSAKSDWLATSLVGLYGLRPAELATLRVEEDRLYVAAVKRNRTTMAAPRPDRLVLPLDLPGREGEGARVLAIFAKGEVKLPVAIRNAAAAGRLKDVGRAFRSALERDPVWRKLVQDNPGLVPYSLRHGYAWRGHKAYSKSIPVRDLSALMGHNTGTHHRHYGAWTSEEDLVQSVAQLQTPQTS